MNFWCRINVKPKNICNNHHLICEEQMVIFFFFFLFFFEGCRILKVLFTWRWGGKSGSGTRRMLDVTGTCRSHVKEVYYYYFFFESSNGRHCASDYRTFLFSNKVFQLHLTVVLSIAIFLTWHPLQNCIKISRTFC